MKNKRVIRIIAVAVLAVMMALSLASCAAGGKSTAKDANGTHGSLSWVYKKDGQILTISGSGAMENFGKASDVAWKEIASSVKKVVVTDEITSVADYAFYNMTLLEDVELGKKVETIGKFALAFTPALKDITLPENVKTVGEGAFEASGIVALKLPVAVETINKRTFVYCDDLAEVVGAGVKKIDAEAFAYCKSLRSISVKDLTAAADTAAIFGEGATVPAITQANANTYTVTVEYVYEDGTQASDTVIRFFEEGTHEIASPAIEGYTADKPTVTVTVNAENTNLTEKVTYTKNPEETESVVETESVPVEDPEDDKLSPWTIVALVGTVVILIGVAVAVIIYVNHDKKKSSAKGQKNNKK